MADDIQSSFSKTVRQIGELLLMLASQLEAESDIHNEEAEQAKARVRAALDRLHQDISETNLLVGVLAQHEADVEADLKRELAEEHAHLEALDARTERRAVPRKEATDSGDEA